MAITADRWAPEVYPALIGALLPVAWLLLLLFLAALIAHVVVRGREAGGTPFRCR